MSRVFIGAILLLCSLASCAVNNEGEHVSKEKMKLILTDIHYAEVYSTMVNDSLQQVTNKNRDSLALYYKEIITHHNISMQELLDNITWYQNHPDSLEVVYQNMIPDITTLQDIQGVK